MSDPILEASKIGTKTLKLPFILTPSPIQRPSQKKQISSRTTTPPTPREHEYTRFLKLKAYHISKCYYPSHLGSNNPSFPDALLLKDIDFDLKPTTKTSCDSNSTTVSRTDRETSIRLDISPCRGILKSEDKSRFSRHRKVQSRVVLSQRKVVFLETKTRSGSALRSCDMRAEEKETLKYKNMLIIS